MHDRPPNPRLTRRRGLTFLEVAIAASILTIATVASLEVLATNDSSGLFARRQALAALEAERVLSTVAETIKAGGSLPSSNTLSSGMVGEALVGCSLTLSTTDQSVQFRIPPASAGGDPRSVSLRVRIVTAEVYDPRNALLVRLERPVPLPAGAGGGT